MTVVGGGNWETGKAQTDETARYGVLVGAYLYAGRCSKLQVPYGVPKSYLLSTPAAHKHEITSFITIIIVL